MQAFITNIDEIDLTAFRLAVIGETTAKISDGLKSRHPDIQWSAIYSMRNVIVHDYNAIEPERLWAVFVDHIDPLANACQSELDKASQGSGDRDVSPSHSR
jgi:uncharacterized protein with HEPN domain